MVHTFKKGGNYFIMDVESGAVHIADRLCSEIVSRFDGKLTAAAPDDLEIEGYTKEETNEAYGELYELQQAGLLYTEPEPIDVDRYAGENAPIKALCLHIAHDCNLNCEYCFADGGHYHQIREHMSDEVAKAAIDFVIERSGARKNIEVDFFGGEPLLNFEVVKNCVEYAEKKGEEWGKKFRFTITTNGVLLDDDKIDYINRHMSNVVISLDGRKEVNDRVRRRLDGNGCYDKVLPAYKRLVERRSGDYYIRGTFTRYNLDFYNDVLHLAQLGFKQISIEPVTAPESAGYSIRNQDIAKISESYDKLYKIMESNLGKEGAFNFFHFSVDLSQGPCIIKRLRGCGCGNEYAAVTPNGDIYPCHQFVGDKKFLMGNVFDKTVDLELKKKFAKANVYTKQGCSECFAKYYCSGGCNANNYNTNGDILKPDEIACYLQRKRTECAVALAAVKRDRGETE